MSVTEAPALDRDTATAARGRIVELNKLLRVYAAAGMQDTEFAGRARAERDALKAGLDAAAARAQQAMSAEYAADASRRAEQRAAEQADRERLDRAIVFLHGRTYPERRDAIVAAAEDAGIRRQDLVRAASELDLLDLTRPAEPGAVWWSDEAVPWLATRGRATL